MLYGNVIFSIKDAFRKRVFCQWIHKTSTIFIKMRNVLCSNSHRVTLRLRIQIVLEKEIERTEYLAKSIVKNFATRLIKHCLSENLIMTYLHVIFLLAIVKVLHKFLDKLYIDELTHLFIENEGKYLLTAIIFFSADGNILSIKGYCWKCSFSLVYHEFGTFSTL